MRVEGPFRVRIRVVISGFGLGFRFRRLRVWISVISDDIPKALEGVSATSTG